MLAAAAIQGALSKLVRACTGEGVAAVVSTVGEYGPGGNVTSSMQQSIGAEPSFCHADNTSVGSCSCAMG